MSKLLLLLEAGSSGETTLAASSAASAIAEACGARLEELAIGGLPVAEIVRRAKEGFDLTVLGVASPVGRAGGRLSLRVWQLAKNLPTHVLLVPEGTGTAFRRILLCTGGETYIEEGVLFTARLAAAIGAEISVLHVLPRAPEFYRSSRPASPSDFLSGESHLARQLRAQMAAIEKLGVPASLTIGEGDVEREIFEATQRLGADMIVVGSSPARGPLGASILGNITREVAGRSPVPILIARSRPPGLLRDLWKILREG